MDARGEIYWSSSGNPRRKVYLDESAGIPVQDIWLEFRDAHNQNIEITGYPTEKNPELLERIIGASSNAEDLVLDCFSGSGTTLAVASQLNRSWIGIDNIPLAIETTLRRFAKGLEPMGDFVAAKRSHPECAPSEEPHNLPLFASVVPAPPGPVQGVEKRMITDFCLYSAEPMAGDLKETVRRWQSWISEGS
jgi:adenine-specific DNA-methyltransferase